MRVSKLESGMFYGVTTRRGRAGDLVLVETTYGSRVEVAPHWHERPYFCYLVRGAFDEQTGRRTRRCLPGSLIFHPAGETHHDRFADRGGVCFNIELPPELLATADGRLPGGFPDAAQFERSAANRLAAQMWREFRRTPAPSALVLEGLGLALVGEASRGVAPDARQPPAWLGRAVDLLHDRFREPIGLRSVAAELDVHAVHVARTFRRYRGVTVGEYVRALRIEFASRELLASGRSIAEIAHASGFADHAHFCRAFRALTGTSPSRFRAARAADSFHESSVPGPPGIR